MTRLEAEVLNILRCEAGYPPMTPASLGRVLHAIGFFPEPSETKIVQALDGLMGSGHVEPVWRRGAPHYRTMKPRTEAESNA